ncbi:hypothetical protein GCM10009613_61370 [Pseudonocardia kongjuensis]|uniref:Uncharacterized protein n=1 Tax=Pseudonocardia kongjuensis TaxID=102227 RepID=A0ABP4J163_9PSEU
MTAPQQPWPRSSDVPPARPRPVNDISNQQQWWAIGGALLPGALVIATVLAAGRVPTLVDLGAAMLAILLPLAGAETARRRTVARAEQVVTPIGSPRDAAGRVLRTRDQDLLEQALDELAERRAAEQAPAAPTGTRSFPAVDRARPMRAPDPPPVTDTERPRRDYERDWEIRSSAPDIREGRAIADRRDRIDVGQRWRGAPRHHRGGD